jgi:hypothetical protein
VGVTVFAGVNGDTRKPRYVLIVQINTNSSLGLQVNAEVLGLSMFAKGMVPMQRDRKPVQKTMVVCTQH